MGATNNIKGTNITLQLVGKECPQCPEIHRTRNKWSKLWYLIWYY